MGTRPRLHCFRPYIYMPSHTPTREDVTLWLRISSPNTGYLEGMTWPRKSRNRCFVDRQVGYPWDHWYTIIYRANLSGSEKTKVYIEWYAVLDGDPLPAITYRHSFLLFMERHQNTLSKYDEWLPLALPSVWQLDWHTSCLWVSVVTCIGYKI